MSFAGVSIVADGKLLRSPTSPATVSPASASGYHLFVVEGHSRTRTPIKSRYFTVGGHRWFIVYSPDGYQLHKPGFISFVLFLAENTTAAVKAQFELSFIDETPKQEPARIRRTDMLEFRGRHGAYVRSVRREAFEEHLKDDSFTVRCDVVVNEVIEVPVPPFYMHKKFADPLLGSEGADVVFQVGGEEFPVHRCVLAAQSTVFRALLFGPMKPNLLWWKPAVLHMDDMDVATFKAMLGFIYGDSDSLLVPTVEDNGVLLQHLLVAADRYHLWRLRSMCENKLRERVDAGTMTTILAHAERRRTNTCIFVLVPRSHRDGPVALEVSSSDTVTTVKARLHDMEGIPPHRQRLVFAGSALPDDADTTLADYGVVDPSTIQLVETKMEVFVNAHRTLVFSGVESSDSVESFRAKFQEREGCQQAQQRFICGGIQMEDGHTLADYGVQHFSMLHFLIRWPLHKRERFVELDIDVRDTIGRIKERVEMAEGVPTEHQTACFGYKTLDDGRTLTDCSFLVTGTPLQIHIDHFHGPGSGKRIKKEVVAEREMIPVVQRRRLRVKLLGPELA